MEFCTDTTGCALEEFQSLSSVGPSDRCLTPELCLFNERRNQGHEEANPDSTGKGAHIPTPGWSSLPPSNTCFKLLMVISGIYVSWNYLKSTSFGAAINNATGNTTKTGENGVI